MTSLVTVTILFLGSVIFHIGGSATDFRFYAIHEVVNVEREGYVGFRIENPHENEHDTTGSVSFYAKDGSYMMNKKLNTRLLAHNQPLWIENVNTNGYYCARWTRKNSSTVEYVCRVARSDATANVSKLIFRMSYQLLDGTARTYNATSTAVLEKVGIGTTQRSPMDILSISTPVGMGGALHSMMNNSAISMVFSQALTTCSLMAIITIHMLHS